MVFSADWPSEQPLHEEQFMADQRRLHNFSWPLKWQNQKTLRPIKFNPFHYLSDSHKALSPIDAFDATALSSPSHPSLVSRFLIKKLQKLPPLLINADDRFETIREKLLLHLRSTPRVREVGEVDCSSEEGIQWNFGMEGRAACEVPAATETQKARADGCAVLVPEGRPRSLRLRGLAPEQSEFRMEIPRFSTSLSLRQIEEDFLAMRGSKPSRRPKKRAKCIQKILDENSPGMLLSNITPDSYKVSRSH